MAWKKIRFDLENVGGIKPKVFLRLLNYNPNEIDEIATKVDNLRTKSCIVSSNGFNERKSGRSSYLVEKDEGKIMKINDDLKIEENDNANITDTTTAVNKNDNLATNVETIEIKRLPTKSAIETKKQTIEAKKPISVVESQIRESDDIYTYYTQRPDSTDRGIELIRYKIFKKNKIF